MESIFNEDEKVGWIYIALFKDYKKVKNQLNLYVGQTTKPKTRKIQHSSSHRGELKRFWLLTPGGFLDELLITLLLQNKFGSANVQGGPYTGRFKDQSSQILNHLNNHCFNCGQPGHQSYECKKNGLSKYAEPMPKKKLKTSGPVKISNSKNGYDGETLLMKDVLAFVPHLYKIFNYKELEHPPIHDDDKLFKYIQECEAKDEIDPDWLDKEYKTGIGNLIKEMSSKHFKLEGLRINFRDIIERVLCNGFKGS